ncbi:MAG: hypothetical protein Q9163_005480 [Psora crenata]
MASSAREQPPWQRPPPHPSHTELPPLKIWNSLTRSKTPFIPVDPNGRKVTWYACGPTVYDDAHLGHARNYVTSDILRRIMRDYFGFDVQYVMNITDIDDKIILRARQQHLLQEFKAGQKNDISTLKSALVSYISKNLDTSLADASPAAIHTIISETYADLLGRNTADENEAKKKMHVKTTLGAARAMTAIEAQTEAGVSTMEDSRNLDDILMPYLDSQYGATVEARDHTIFTKLTRRHEERFTEDMRALNVLDPDVTTRVTEYGAQIVDFVSRIEQNGFAYKTSKGVYFDVDGFERANNHYARLEPWNRNDQALQADGEGAISGKENKKVDLEKRSQADFALWKFSKPGEPSWPSPWGDGRPGWHIECSAMASDKLGSQLDIHSGGIDLAFPHHDNELAQSEAYWCDTHSRHQHQWVNYFVHMGHLSIAGAKMSKSLKNFTTIRDALSSGTWTSRGLRIVLLLGGWREGIEITGDLVKAGLAWEDKVDNFFIKAKDILPDRELQALGLSDPTDGSASTSILLPTDKSTATEMYDSIGHENGGYGTSVEQALDKAKRGTFAALCDSFNTAVPMGIISGLITTYNAADPTPSPAITVHIARWITTMVNMFGLNGVARPSDPVIGWSGLDVPEADRPTLSALSSLRDQLRTRARSPEGIMHADIEDLVATSTKHVDADDGSRGYADLLQAFWASAKSQPDDKDLARNVLALCDRIRDVDLWQRGIYLEDREGNKPALIRLVSKEMQVGKEEKERQKQKAKAQRDAEAAAKAEKGRLSHTDMFKTDDYSAWDEEGLPTRDKEGLELTKSRGKKLRKDWERQKKLHESWLKVHGIIPGHQIPPLVYAAFAVYVTWLIITPGEETKVNGKPKPPLNGKRHSDKNVSPSTSTHQGDGWQRAKTWVMGVPSPGLTLSNIATVAFNLFLLLGVLDVVYRGQLFYPSRDLSFTRVGYVSDTTAKILVREPDTAQFPVYLSYRALPDSALNDSWKAAGTLEASLESKDYTRTFTIKGLRASTHYQYALSTNHTGFFRTAPTHGRLLDGKFTFLTSSCLKPRFPYSPLSHPLAFVGLRHLATWLPRLNAQFMVFLGDFIYIDVPHRHGYDAETYRSEYRRVYASPDWPAASQGLPWLHVIDDHEIANDWDRGLAHPYPEARDPWDIYHASVNPPQAEINASYFTFTQGPASFFMLDTRRYRTPSASNPATSPNKTMLGPAQLSSLLHFLQREEAAGIKWKFVISSIPFTRNWRVNSKDTWAGYLHERREVLEAMWDVSLRGDGVGVVLLSGDRHEFAATAFPPPKGGRWPLSATVHEFSTSPLSMFYLPIRSYWEVEGEGERDGMGEDVCIKYLPDGNSKFGAVELEQVKGNEQGLLRFRLFVDGVETWQYVLMTPPAVAGGGRGKDAIWG